MRRFRTEMASLLKVGMSESQAASKNPGQGHSSLSSRSNCSIMPMLERTLGPLTTETEIIPETINGIASTESGTDLDWQQNVEELLKRVLVHNLDALAMAIVQPLQFELLQVVSLLIDQRNGPSAAETRGSTSGHSPADLWGSPPTQHLTQTSSTQKVKQQYQDAEKTKAKSQGHNAKERTDHASPACSQPEREADKRKPRSLCQKRMLTVAAHRVIVTNSATHSMQLEWPDSAAASRATYAAAALRGGTQERLLASKRISRLTASVGDRPGRCSTWDNSQSKDTEASSKGRAGSPPSLSDVQGGKLRYPREVSHLSSSQMESPNLKTLRSSSWSASSTQRHSALRGISSRADIVFTSP